MISPHCYFKRSYIIDTLWRQDQSCERISTSWWAGTPKWMVRDCSECLACLDPVCMEVLPLTDGRTLPSVSVLFQAMVARLQSYTPYLQDSFSLRAWELKESCNASLFVPSTCIFKSKKSWKPKRSLGPRLWKQINNFTLAAPYVWMRSTPTSTGI